VSQVTNSELAHYHDPKAGDHFKAQHITYQDFRGNVYNFDSRWELNIFRILRGFSFVSKIEKDYRLLVLPKTLHYPSRHWRVDFKVNCYNTEGFFLECKSEKSALHADFRRSLENLSFFNPSDFERLLIVLPDSNKRSLDKVSKYLRVPVYPEGLFKGATLLTATQLKEFLTVQKPS